MARNLWDTLLDASIFASFDRTGFERHARTFDAHDLELRLTGVRALVTGANSGIGFATAVALAERDAEVVLCCRDADRGRAAMNALRDRHPAARVELAVLDVSQLADVRRFAAAQGDRPVHLLVHNAGTMPDDRTVTPEGLEVTLATHVLGPHLLTRLLTPALTTDGEARVVWVASGGMYSERLSLDDPECAERKYAPMQVYAQTKRMQVVLSALWAEKLRGTGVVVHAMHPGWADTPAVRRYMPRFHARMEGRLRTPEQGADTVIWLCVADAPGHETGRFYFDRAPRRTHLVPWTRESEADAAELWAYCERRVDEVGL
jgi:NAD(P)-dependent dehydrogenase (short-subunit alcohol dehydrogenase family)